MYSDVPITYGMRSSPLSLFLSQGWRWDIILYGSKQGFSRCCWIPSFHQPNCGQWLGIMGVVVQEHWKDYKYFTPVYNSGLRFQPFTIHSRGEEPGALQMSSKRLQLPAAPATMTDVRGGGNWSPTASLQPQVPHPFLTALASHLPTVVTLL